jgi:hypothetical protein
MLGWNILTYEKEPAAFLGRLKPFDGREKTKEPRTSNLEPPTSDLRPLTATSSLCCETRSHFYKVFSTLLLAHSHFLQTNSARKKKIHRGVYHPKRVSRSPPVGPNSYRKLRISWLWPWGWGWGLDIEISTRMILQLGVGPLGLRLDCNNNVAYPCPSSIVITWASGQYRRQWREEAACVSCH